MTHLVAAALVAQQEPHHEPLDPRLAWWLRLLSPARARLARLLSASVQRVY
jgi:hypothetical protein